MTCFVYPSANRTLLLQERTGHLGAQPVETHLNTNCFCSNLFFCFDRHFEFSRGLPLYSSSQTPVPRSPFPVPRSRFPVLVTSILLARGNKVLTSRPSQTVRRQVFIYLFIHGSKSHLVNHNC